MAMSLTKPAVGSTGWGLPVNLNFQTLEDFCNNVGDSLLNAVPVMKPSQGGQGKQGLVPSNTDSDSPNFLAGDGEWRQAGGPWGVVPVMEGDHGSGGAAGLVPAQGVGDANSALGGDGAWHSWPSFVQIGQNLGDLLVWNGTYWERFARGNSGQRLAMNSTGDGLVWLDP